MSNKSILAIICISLLCCCENKVENRGKNELCLDQLVHFSDTLNLINASIMDEFSMKAEFDNCNLKEFRKNLRYQEAVCLIILKAHQKQILQSYDSQVAVLAQISPLASRIASDYAYFYYGRDIYYDESLKISSVIGFIKKRQWLLKNLSIKKIYVKLNDVNSLYAP